MTTITAKDVGELRKVTGAGLMDCKKALQDAEGDFDGAVEILRKKGQKVAAKRADRDANEGVVVAYTDGEHGLLLGLGCETDFVAKNDDFIAFANQVAKLAMENGAATKEDVLALEIDGTPVSERLIEKTGVIGLTGDNVASYIHAGGKIGVLVAYKDGGHDEGSQFFRKLAMHIAAMAPSIMHPDEFDEEFVVKEAEALKGQITVENEDRARLGKALRNVPELAAEGKPEKIWDKILPGKLERFIADNTLLDQERCLLSQFFALDDSKSVEAAIKDFHEDAEVLAFRRIAVG